VQWYQRLGSRNVPHTEEVAVDRGRRRALEDVSHAREAQWPGTHSAPHNYGTVTRVASCVVVVTVARTCIISHDAAVMSGKQPWRSERISTDVTGAMRHAASDLTRHMRVAADSERSRSVAFRTRPRSRCDKWYLPSVEERDVTRQVGFKWQRRRAKWARQFPNSHTSCP